MFDLTDAFFREQLFKGLRQNILENNTWGSYNVIPCIDDLSTVSDDDELKNYINQERFVQKKKKAVQVICILK